MTNFSKSLSVVLLFLLLIVKANGQAIILDFTNETLSADHKQWTFDLMGKGDPAYGGVDNGLWIAFNIRMDMDLPAGISVLSGTGTGSPTYASASIAVQTIIANVPPGKTGLGLTLERNDSDQDLNTTDFVKLGTYTVVFSDAVSSFKVTPRTSTDEIEGSSWVNSSNEFLYRPFIFVDNQIALPVKLVAFNASREGKSTQVTWSTSEESNSAYFELQRSADGKSWSKVAHVPAKGESTGLVDYAAVDDAPLAGKNLYRLKMVDHDGASALSRIRAVDFASRYAFFPNPASDELVIDAENWQNVKRVAISDVKGVEVYRSSFIPEKRIDLKGIRTGTYIVQLVMENARVESHRIVIAR